MYMPKSRPKFYKGSHKIGDLVEFIGRDFHNRGLGVIVEQCENKDYVRVFWQTNRIYEEIHKAKIKRILDIQYVK
jgi:hypothetical protein